MKQHIQTLISLLQKNDVKGLLQHYLASNESENLVQLAFVFQQGQKNLARFEFYQQLATEFIQSKGLPTVLIAQINSSDALNFFTPALQLGDNFNQTNQQQRNVLHALFAGKPSAQSDAQPQPPFNYLRSMMLFESNEALHDALCQRDSQSFTPIELYLFANQNLTTLPDHEFTALLAMIEIESKKHAIDSTNYLPIVNSVNQHCLSQSRQVDSELQRLLLIATYFEKSVAQILEQMN